MDKFIQILNALIPFEEAILPIFIHNPKSQQIAGIVLVGESVVPQVAQQIIAASQTAQPGK